EKEKEKEKDTLEATLLKMELLSMTPLDALNQLHLLQQQLKNKRAAQEG
ncbi:MAG: hypothetical protein GX800_09640, partial [Clostridiaceae bacterium]|nr:hypothetical protein [Clostridiaceae bacterium]